MSNQMPDEILALSIAERILSHIKDQFTLPEEDKAYLATVNAAFKIIHGEEDKENIPKKLRLMFEHLSNKAIAQLIDDVTFIYGDFFVINQAAMRVIQERRHERVFEAAMLSQDFAAAERAAKSIDQLHRRYDVRDKLPSTSRRLPKVVRTSNTSALKKLNGTDE